jgi:hypothetical protein
MGNKTESDINEISNADLEILLDFQRTKVEYEQSCFLPEAVTDAEVIQAINFESDYVKATMAFDNFEDAILLALGKEANGGGKRAIEATDELFALSLRIGNLFPLQSHKVN